MTWGTEPKLTRKRTASQEVAYKSGYEVGFAEGLAVAKKRQAADLASSNIEAKIKLMQAVGQALQVNASLLSGLGQVFDNGPR